MKSFFQFLTEAQSQASMQAKKLNLVSDGHGGWLDSRGNIVATTEDGKLKFKNIFGKVMYRKADLNVPRNYRTYEPGYVPWGTDSPAQIQ